MRKAFPRILCILLCTSLFLDAAGQVKSEQENKLAVLKKDTAYKRFQTQLATIMKTAKGRNTNYAAVKTLFEKNKLMLESLKKKYKLVGSVKAADNSIKLTIYEDRAIFIKLKNTVLASNLYNYDKTGPFDPFYGKLDLLAMKWHTIESGYKISFTSSNDKINLGSSAFGFHVPITVPNIPEIVGVQLEFDYSVFLTGWDSEGGDLSTILGFSAGYTFNSPSYEALPVSTVMDSNNDGFPHYYKLARLFLNRDFNEMDDYVYTREGTFTIESYVTPGKTYHTMLVAGYTQDSKIGDWESYHFGEFELKKVRVKFLKAGE
jgi:hypothetical protein